MSFKVFMKELNNGDVEGELLKTIFVSLVTSFIFIAILYVVTLRTIEGFLPQYGFHLFFAMLSYAVILPAVRHVRAYKEFPCMTGMMIGMTIGMIAGFLPGFFIGATNGMFWGSVVGMSVGIYLGASNGRCGGIMGIIEGIMAGFMGGLMGAMTAVMMYNDNLYAAGVIVFSISAVILIGLNYMIYVEARGAERKHKDDEFYVMLWSFALTAVTVWFMVFGPKSPLFGGYYG